MTTVGYGDKVPKSFFARVFSVIWIIVGIICFSLVTAILTSEITAANSPHPPSIGDAKIGMIQEHMYEAIVVANQGGITIPVQQEENGKFSAAIAKLILMLSKGEIDGFVLDKYEMMLYYNEFDGNPNYQETNELLKKTTLTEITHEEDFSYGILVKNIEDYHFLEEFVTSNRDVISSCNNLLLRKYTRKFRRLHPKHSIFTTEGEIFWPTFMSFSVLVAIIVVCGTIFELKRMISNQGKCGHTILDRYRGVMRNSRDVDAGV